MSDLAIILLVEDNAMDIELTLDAFKEVNLANRVEVVRNGEEALAYLKGRGKYSNRSRYPLPDIILLDLKMPRKDGHEVLKEIKKTPVIKRIPVIILTSSKEEGDRALSYDTGANSYLVKPVSFNGFLEVVNKIGEYWLSLNKKPPIE
jgi:CheY-like chemotaxis protein